MSDLAELPPLSLTIQSAKVEDGRLLVEYVIRSGYAGALYVSNVLTDWYGLSADEDDHYQDNRDARPLTTLAYAKVLPAEERLLLWVEGTTPLPPRAPSGQVRGAGWSRVDSGKESKFTIDLPVPVPEWSAYQMPPEQDECREVLLKKVRLSLEYVLEEHVRHADEHVKFKDIWVVKGRPRATAVAEGELSEPMRVVQRVELEAGGGAYKWA